MSQSTAGTESNDSTAGQSPAAESPSTISAFRVAAPQISPSPANSPFAPETIDALQRGYDRACERIIDMAAMADERLHKREVMRIVFGGIALVALSVGLVAFAFYLAFQHQYTTAAAVFGGSVVATAISNLGDRMLGR